MNGTPVIEPSAFLPTQPADRAEKRLATAAAVVTLIAFTVLAPFAGVPLARAPLFLGVYQSALVLCDLITAVFLFGQFRIARSLPLLVLACGYLFSASMAVFHALSFPGLFSPTGLLGAGPQTTAWLYFLWHLGFPATVIAYALMSGDRTGSAAGPHRLGSVTLAVAVACAVTLAVAAAMMFATTAGQAALPTIMRGDRDMPAKYVVAWATWLATFAALPILWRRKPLSALNLWLMIVIGAWLCDVAQAAVFNSGRYSLGWYAGRVYGLFAASFLLAVLLLENGRLYLRLARLHAVERGQRRLLEQRTAELDGLNRSLEQRVSARTAELARSNEQLRRSKEELRQLAMWGTTAREQERTRLARELHDELDQTLIYIKLQLGWLEEQLPGRGALVASKILRMQEVIDHALAATRRIEEDLRPVALDDLGFAAAAEWLVAALPDDGRTERKLTMDPPRFELEEPYSTVIFRIMQESLANVVRHARAARVEVVLTLRDGEVQLHVADDGIGFDGRATLRRNAFGLLGMRERVHLVAGRIRVDSAPGRGTTIDVTIPLETCNADRA